MTKPLGVYVHFPFCKRRCPYCDFATTAGSPPPHREYARAVLADLEGQVAAGMWEGREVRSIYFGGGTPSLWEPGEIARVMSGIVNLLPVRSNAEVTLEANPEPGELGNLSLLLEAGVNRLSLGIQSFQQKYLDALGRRHEEEHCFTAIEKARSAGFDNISIDLIHGCPGQSSDGAKIDAELAADCNVDHVSAYCLTIEEGVPMELAARSGEVELPGEDAAAEIEEAVIDALALNGFIRYEVSSFAKEGRLSEHNLGYWSCREFVGVGAGAHGFRLNGKAARDGGTRYRNLPDPALYLAESAGPAAAGSPKWGWPWDEGRSVWRSEHLEAENLLRQALWLGLGTAGGVDLARLAEWSGIDPRLSYEPTLARLEGQGLIVRSNDKVRPTRLGFRFNDSLVASL